MDGGLFRRFCEIAYEKAGICLKAGKESLVAARVAKRQRALGVREVREYLALLEGEGGDEELVHFLDAISTNYTSFFREPEHFELFELALRAHVLAGRKRLRVWCAASSTGEEPYSIVMTALEATRGRPMDFRLLATDISTRVLAQAEQGVYGEAKMAPVSPAQRASFFDRRQGTNDEEAVYEVKPQLKAQIVFKRLNLVRPRYPMDGPLDFVFCRNVMMYFDDRLRGQILAQIERLLARDGILFIGQAESLTGLQAGFAMIRPAAFCHSDSAMRWKLDATGPGQRCEGGGRCGHAKCDAK